jgi:hypothetical protein
MADKTPFNNGIELVIDERKSPKKGPEAVFTLKNDAGSRSLAKIVGIGDGDFGGKLAFETNAGGEGPTEKTVGRLTIDHAGTVGIGGSLTVGGTLKTGAIDDVGAEITTLKKRTFTAKDVGALPIGGGTLTGKLDVKGALDATEIRMKGKPLTLSPWNEVKGGITYNSGSVGIGTTTPTKGWLLDVFTDGADGAHLMLGGRRITLKGVNDPAKWEARLPHIEWREGDNTRAMYLGYGDTGKKHIHMQLENKYKLIISGGIVEIEQEDWKDPPLANGWINYGDGYNPAEYFKDSMGIVHLRGLVKGGKPSNESPPMFTLPEGYRPKYRNLHVACTYSNQVGSVRPGRVDILTNGDVIPLSGDKTWFSLDGITFRAGG